MCLCVCVYVRVDRWIVFGCFFGILACGFIVAVCVCVCVCVCVNGWVVFVFL